MTQRVRLLTLPFISAIFLVFGLFFVGIQAICTESNIPALLKPSLLCSYPHNSHHFTQGLFFHRGFLYESTGEYGKSVMAVKDPQTGKSILEKKLAADFFGEGSVVAEKSLYLLSWQNGKALVLNPETLEEKGSFSYEGEGWGLAYDGKNLIRSDGSSLLHFHDLAGKLIFSKKIFAGNQPLVYINELEWLPKEGLLLANIWHLPFIAVIDVSRAKLVAWLDLRDFIPKNLKDAEAVLNGIALFPDGKSLWVTGKNWPLVHVFAWPVEGLPTVMP